jgi:hypothetical protein
MMVPFIFTCPATLMNVQHLRDDDPDLPATEYEPVTCTACTRIHLVNRKTGKLLGENDLSARKE